MKKEVLITVSYITEIEGSLSTGESQSLSEHFPRSLKLGDNLHAEWVITSQVTLNPQYNNCTKCTACGSWITDRSKPDCLGLGRVESVDDQIYCCECAIFARAERKQSAPEAHETDIFPLCRNRNAIKHSI